MDLENPHLMPGRAFDVDSVLLRVFGIGSRGPEGNSLLFLRNGAMRRQDNAEPSPQ
jgi:hypothetical protein